jgi:hypothetical protein
MKQYVVDELRSEDYNRIESYLDEELGVSGVPGLYKLRIDIDLLTDLQVSHTECQPFYFAIDLEPDRMASEFLVRTDYRIGCNCMGYATEKQRNWLIQFTDTLLDRLEISV